MKATIGLILLGIVVFVCGCTTRDFYGMELIDNPNAQNVSCASLSKFLKQDDVNEHLYYLPSSEEAIEIMDDPGWNGEPLGYVCVHFARDLHNNAEVAGIRCAIVRIPERNHICNAFETTDRGLLFVDVSTELDSIAYERNGQLVVDAKIKEGIGDKAILFLGNLEDFIIEW